MIIIEIPGLPFNSSSSIDIFDMAGQAGEVLVQGRYYKAILTPLLSPPASIDSSPHDGGYERKCLSLIGTIPSKNGEGGVEGAQARV